MITNLQKSPSPSGLSHDTGDASNEIADAAARARTMLRDYNACHSKELLTSRLLKNRLL